MKRWTAVVRPGRKVGNFRTLEVLALEIEHSKSEMSCPTEEQQDALNFFRSGSTEWEWLNWVMKGVSQCGGRPLREPYRSLHKAMKAMK